ncbi:FliM/FliN family flagellar motor switch protein [Buchnera aphidicola (Pemphigus obesinymphae)]|uniref:FliM/FliN family flagellar motor switch protein n=1 Tax=Buchnera aphidicola TaxID=9 RepID=UPI002237DD9C|nr:FliM/FliN family flagellar motor switch protein [Buchnera aphidicola]MCW5196516.1 FliM/FliN family flagellar motor switch protein [Buchnera aphidicola (Pemphigus obesinymphae)]
MEIKIDAINNTKNIVNNYHNIKDNKKNVSITKKKQIRTCNVKNYYHVIQNDINLLKRINNFFINQFSIDLAHYLNINKIDVKLYACNIENDKPNIKHVKKTMVLNTIDIKACEDSAYMIFYFDFISMIVENLFGGNTSRENINYHDKTITDTECKIIKNVTKIAIKAYEESIKKFFPIQMSLSKYKAIVNGENTFHFKKNTYFVTTFHILIGNYKGSFNVLIPLIKIKKCFLYTNITKEKKDYKNVEKDNMINNIHNLKLTLTVQLKDSVISLSNILNLQLGDIIPIQKPEFGIVYVDNFPILSGKYKIVNGRHALCVEDLAGFDIKSKL